MSFGLTSIWRTSRTHGRKRGNSRPLSSYRFPRMMTCPFSLKSKCVSRNPQTSRLSASVSAAGRGGSGTTKDPSEAGPRRCAFSNMLLKLNRDSTGKPVSHRPENLFQVWNVTDEDNHKHDVRRDRENEGGNHEHRCQRRDRSLLLPAHSTAEPSTNDVKRKTH